MPVYPSNTYTTITNLNAGDFVVLYKDPDLPPDFYPPAYILKVQKAAVEEYRLVIGYVVQSYGAGSVCQVFALGGVNWALSGLVPGTIYYSDPLNPGGITSTFPTGTEIVQQLGIALSTNHLDTLYNDLFEGTGASGGGGLVCPTSDTLVDGGTFVSPCSNTLIDAGSF
jgi:hypothetical protein